MTAPDRAPRETLPGHRADGTADGCLEPDCQAAVARGDRWVGPFLSVEAGGRAHFHHRQERSSRVRAGRVTRFAALSLAYDRDPGDFYTAWCYLVEHPVFHRPVWPRGAGRTVADMTDEEKQGPPPFVEDDDGLADLWLYVTRSDPRQVTFHLEHGPHLWPEDIGADEHWCTPIDGIASHDPALDVVAASYEEAIVLLAARVRARYGHDRSRVTRPDDTTR